MKVATILGRLAGKLPIHARSSWIAIAAVLLPLALPAVAVSWPNERNGWMIGLGVGGGSSGISANGQSSDRESGAAASVRTGYVFTPELAAGLETNVWTKDINGVTFTFSVAAAALTFYPGGQGFFARGGVGAGSVELETKVGSTTITGSDSGLGLTGGLGYEWRVTRSLALAPQVDYGFASLNGYSVNYVNGTLQANWYFIPK